MTTDPVKLAERLARQAIPAQTALVSQLVTAVAALESARGLSVAAKDARAVVGSALSVEIGQVASATKALEAAARQGVKRAREAALSGGWSLAALRQIGALGPAVQRPSRAAGEGNQSPDRRWSDDDSTLMESMQNGEISPIREELQ